MPELQFAKPISKYIETTGVLQKMAGEKQRQEQMAESHGLQTQSRQLGLEGQRSQNQLLEMEQQSRARQNQEGLLQDIAVGAAYADTPEKWNEVIDHFVSRGLKDAENYRDSFDKREMFIKLGHPDTRGEAMTEFQRLSLDVRQQELDFRKQQQGDVKLTPTTQKILDTAQTAAFDSGTQANEMELLAKDLGALDVGGGVASTTTEKFKQILGSQEEVTDLRRRFRGFRASQAVNNLPPGVASDKDIELALSGFPAENANSLTIQRFLRGQSKLARLDQAYNTLKSELISEKGSTSGLLKEWKAKLKDQEFVGELFAGIEGISQVEDTSTIQRPPPQADSQVAQFQEGQTATNPQTGERLVFANGQWQPAP